MDKKLIIGGLAVVGAVALFMYLKPKSKPRLNSDGFFGATGSMGGNTGRMRKARCRRPNGTYYTSNYDFCDQGSDVRVGSN